MVASLLLQALDNNVSLWSIKLVSFYLGMGVAS